MAAQGGGKVSGKRRGHGEGTLYQRKQGNDSRWEATIVVDGEKYSRYGKTRQEALRKLTDLRRSLEEQTPLGDERQTVGEFLERWLDGKAKLRPGTLTRYREYLMLHTVPALGRLKLKMLTPQHLERLYADRLRAGASSTSVHHQHVVIQEALTSAVRQGLIYRNPAQLVDAPPLARSEIHPLLEEQARTLLASVQSERLYSLYVTALATGMRQGELLALRWRDVDLDGGFLAVRRSVRFVAGTGFVFDEPKTKRGRRTIGLSPAVCMALQEHRQVQGAEKARLGTAWEHPELVFPTSVGTPIQGSWLLRHLRQRLARVDLPAIRFHDLRHTAATILLSHNVNPKVVSEMLGHSSVAITLDIYSHVLPHMQHDAAAMMAQALFGGSNGDVSAAYGEAGF
jgi:integrase